MSAKHGGSEDVIRLVDVLDEDLSVDDVLAAVSDPRAGGVVVFVGTVRERDHDKDVDGLAYSAHPSVMRKMREVAESVREAHDVVAIAVTHRVGALDIEDVAVVAGVSAVHRGEAFEACRMLIDTLKAEVPIWKHQEFGDGTDEWVGTP